MHIRRERETSPLASWLLADSWGNAFWVPGAGKEADGGKTEVGEVTNALESPAEKIHPRIVRSDTDNSFTVKNKTSLLVPNKMTDNWLLHIYIYTTEPSAT